MEALVQQLQTAFGNAFADMRQDERMRDVGVYNPRSISSVEAWVIHHSAGRKDQSPFEIRNYHVNTLGWPGIGYHFLVYDPEVYVDWPAVIYVGSVLQSRACVANMNHKVVCICLVGNFETERPSDAHLDLTRRLLDTLDTVLGTRPRRPHRDYRKTACPGKYMDMAALEFSMKDTIRHVRWEVEESIREIEAGKVPEARERLLRLVNVDYGPLYVLERR